MSTSSYNYKPYESRVVKYTYFRGGQWVHKQTHCYSGTDEEAITEFYRTIVYPRYFHHDTLHITEIVRVVHGNK